MKKSYYLCTRKTDKGDAVLKHNAEIAQLVEHNLAKVGVASSSLVFRSKSKSFEDKIKQNPLKHRFRGFFIYCLSVSLRHGVAPTRHSPNLEVSLRISTVKIRDTYSEIRGHFDIFSAFYKLFRLTVAYALIKNSQMKSTFRILFYAKWEASDEAKMLPIYVRITINGTKARFSLKIRVSEKIWDAKSGRAIGHSHEALQANRYLDSVVTRINTIYYRLCEQSEAVTAQMVRDEFLGVKAPSKTLLSVFAEFNDRQENLIGVDITQSTFNKFDLTFRRLEEFLRVKRNRPDIPVSLIDRDFVLDFEAYLKVDYRLQANSAEKLMRIFKRITTMCFKSGLMAKDPFCDVRLKKVKKDRGYLTRHELELILNYKPTKKRLEKARDVFVFCCFTGFDYSTTASLTEQNLVLADDGSMWIETHRVKTGVASKVKLLDIPLSILKKYEPTRINGYLLPVLSNAKYNLYLKEIATALGIQKRVTSHLARHTFATTVTYANGVSIESISKMLGHTKLATTQIYARIVDQTVSREMDKLSAALSGTSFSLNGGETSTHETAN